MRLQAPVTLAPRETPSGPVIVFIREGAVTGVLELVAHASLVTDVLVQWNPHKLSMWQEPSQSPGQQSV